MVTICTASLTFSNSTFCPQNVFICFVWISEQTAIISLYNINWLVFVTDLECVYCAVRTDWLQFSPLHSDRTHSTTLAHLYERSHCVHLLHHETCQNHNTSEDAPFSVSKYLSLYFISTCSILFAPAQWTERWWKDQLRTDKRQPSVRCFCVNF